MRKLLRRANNVEEEGGLPLSTKSDEIALHGCSAIDSPLIYSDRLPGKLNGLKSAG